MATFALSRFREVEGTGKIFRRPPGFDARAYAREAFGITRGEKNLRVRLLFEPKLAVYLMERDWHPSQQFTRRPDGRVEMRLETSGRKELIRWVLSWMPDVKVLAPKSLRDRIEEKLRDGFTRQEGLEKVSTSSSSEQAGAGRRSRNSCGTHG
jgi:predicted DNA-binding transcriptional regulator YafY